MDEYIEKLNELIVKDEEIRLHGLKIIEKADIALENLKTLEVVIPTVIENSQRITDLLTHIKELYDNQCSFVQSILNLQAKILQIEERLQKVEEDNKLIRMEKGWGD